MAYTIEKLKDLGITLRSSSVLENSFWNDVTKNSGWRLRRQSFTPVLMCRICGQEFLPETFFPGKYHRGYWMCPHQCNKGASKWTKAEIAQIEFID